LPSLFKHKIWRRPESSYFNPALGGMDPGARPGLDPGFAGVTIQETFYEAIFYGF
jgi:hypothetical protein